MNVVCVCCNNLFPQIQQATCTSTATCATHTTFSYTPNPRNYQYIACCLAGKCNSMGLYCYVDWVFVREDCDPLADPPVSADDKALFAYGSPKAGVAHAICRPWWSRSEGWSGLPRHSRSTLSLHGCADIFHEHMPGMLRRNWRMMI